MAYRLDRAISLVCQTLTHGKIDADKFMPRFAEEESEEGFTQVFSMLKSKAKTKGVKNGK